MTIQTLHEVAVWQLGSINWAHELYHRRMCDWPRRNTRTRVLPMLIQG